MTALIQVRLAALAAGVVLLQGMSVPAAAVAVTANLWDGVQDAVTGTDPAAGDGRCVIADLSKPAGTAFSAATPPLAPGVYRAVLRLKLPLISDVNTAPLSWVVTVADAGRGSRAFDILLIETAGVYQEIPCRFVVAKRGVARISLAWVRKSINPDRRAETRVAAPKAPSNHGLGDDAIAGDLLDLEAELSDEPPVDGLDYLYGAVDRVTIEQLADVDIEVLEVDKIRYRPGTQATISLAVRNYAEAARELRVETVLISGLDQELPVADELLNLAAGERRDFTLTGPVFETRWGYAVRARLYDGAQLLLEKQEYFTVHENMWAVVIAGRGAAQFTGNITRESAIASAHANKRRYRNWIESGFWAPDEFGDFTPDTENWWGGQGCYYGGVTGTRVHIEEGHRLGISFAVYSNIWGGDGPPAFEMIRRRPDWGYASTFNVEWLERWNRNTMGTGRDGTPMHVWPYTIINHGGSDGPALHHAHELIESHRTLGWDAVRYDSHGIDDETARIMSIVKDAVHAEVPEYQFGYNSSVVHRDPSKAAAFRSHCENGALIMEEGIRQFGGGGLSYSGGATYEAFARRILDFKAEARENGGNFLAIGMDKCYPNDLVYQYIFWFAGNTHPCYDWADASVADYAQFATRYAGLLWDLKVTPVSAPEAWVDFGGATERLWLWRDYVHQREMSDGTRQLIVHLINAPTEQVLYTHDDCKVPPVLENVPVILKPPAEVTVDGVWYLTPEYELTQTSLPHRPVDGGIAVTVPKVRFWSMLVMSMSSPAADR